MKYSIEIIDTILKYNKDISFFVLDKSYHYIKYNEVHAQHVKLFWNTDITKIKTILDCYKDERSIVEFKNKMNRVLSGESFTQIDSQSSPFVSHTLFFEVTWSPLIQDNQIIGIICISKDITETVNIKSEFDRHQAIFEAFFNQGLDGSLIVLLDEPIVWNDQINQDVMIERILDTHRVIRVNQAYLDQYGYKMEEILNHTAREIYSDIIDDLKLFWLKLLNEKQVIRERKQKRLNGKEFWVKSEFQLFYDDYGRVLGYFGSQQDITEAKRLERESKYADEKLKYIIENEKTSIAIFDRDMKYLYVSKGFISDFKLDNKNVIGKSHYELFPGLDKEIIEAHRSALNGEIISVDNSKFENEQGETEWLRWECRPWYEKDKSIGGIILYTEFITNRIKLENELKKREANLSAMFEQAAVGMSYGPHRLLTRVNQKYCDIVGYTKEELAELTYMDVTHPEDIKKDADLFARLLNGEINTYTIEKRLIRKNGSIIWINLTVSIVPQVDGEIFVFAVIEDINDRKNAELSMNYLNYHDQLTGCLNRRCYEEAIQTLDNKSSYPFSLVMVDADGLKLINDALGHLYGDQLLISIAKLLKDTVQDVGEVFRIGGDEFIITLPNTRYEDGLELIQTINSKLNTISIRDFNVSVSCGCATKFNSSQSMIDVFSQAEDIMYREKLMNSQNTIQKALDHILVVLFERSQFEKSHAKNIVDYCAKIADALHYSVSEKEQLLKAAYMHDIGKIGIGTQIIEKKGLLSNVEMKEIRRHAEIGYRILNSSNHYSDISMIVLAHHEHWDGMGYPKGLKETEIPEFARIIAIAEAYDVLISKDSYKQCTHKSDAFNILLSESGKHFDPELVIKFVETIGKSA